MWPRPMGVGVVANHPSQARVVSNHLRSQIDLEKTISRHGKKFHRKIGFSVVKRNILISHYFKPPIFVQKFNFEENSSVFDFLKKLFITIKLLQNRLDING